MKKRYTYLLIISLVAMNLIACNKNNETLENKVETEQSEQSESEIVETESVEETTELESEFISIEETEVTETIEVETETESVETSGLIKQEEGGSSLTDEEWAEYDAKFQELIDEMNESSTESDNDITRNNPITKEEWNNHNW